MKQLRTFMVCMLLMSLGIGPVSAKMQKITIPVILPQFASEMSGDGWVESGIDYTLGNGIGVYYNNWNPETGQIRVDCADGCWGSNFTFLNRTAIPGAITRIVIVYSSGELIASDLQMGMLSGSFPVYDENHHATITPGQVIWNFKKEDKFDKFRIEVLRNNDNTSKVLVSAIVVYFDNEKHSNSGSKQEGGSGSDGSRPSPQPEDGDEIGSQPIGDPIQPGKGGGNKQGTKPGISKDEPAQEADQSGQTPSSGTKPGQGNQPSHNKGGGQQLPVVKDLTKPAPPGIRRTCSKNLLETLTEAELAPLAKVWGEECEEAARDWMTKIPKIKKETSAECQAALRALTYDDYMQYCHGFLETLAILLHDFGTIVDRNYNKSDEEFLRESMSVMIVIGPELYRLYQIKEPNINKKMEKYVEENVPFYNVMEKYKLGKYIF